MKTPPEPVPVATPEVAPVATPAPVFEPQPFLGGSAFSPTVEKISVKFYMPNEDGTGYDSYEVDMPKAQEGSIKLDLGWLDAYSQLVNDTGVFTVTVHQTNAPDLQLTVCIDENGTASVTNANLATAIERVNKDGVVEQSVMLSDGYDSQSWDASETDIQVIDGQISVNLTQAGVERLGAEVMAPIRIHMSDEFEASHVVMLDRREVGHDILELPQDERQAAFLAIDTPEAAEILMALDIEDAHRMLQSLNAEGRAAVISKLSPAAADNFLMLYGAVEAAQSIGHMEDATAIAVLNQTSVERQLLILDRLEPAKIAALLKDLPPETGAAFIGARNRNVANFQEMRSQTLTLMSGESLGPILSIMGPTTVTAILAGDRTRLGDPEGLERYSSILARMTPETAAVELGDLGNSDIAAILDAMPIDRPRPILEHFDPQRANTIIGLTFMRMIHPFDVPAAAPDANDPAHDELK